MHSVVHVLTADVVGPHAIAGRLTTHLRHLPDDPLAVHCDFFSPGGRRVTTWVFARALLEEGVHGPAGEGDVRVCPAGPRTTEVTLRSPSGQCVLHLRTAAVLTYLARSDAWPTAVAARVASAVDELLTGLHAAG
ncbi:SsgA family sporulation/cell division regulator [Streptomyces sp. NPDC059651]|uniref:SsgA family sporulation/cell division regulator n=1 Tax=Streptomyces sp. NPDC059651 TaxID=3346897 RepID=UPI0036A0C587